MVNYVDQLICNYIFVPSNNFSSYAHDWNLVERSAID
jgi:hypothetical protein